jgi:hypothetical protein
MNLISKKTVIDTTTYEPRIVLEMSMPAMTLYELRFLEEREMFEVLGRVIFDMLTDAECNDCGDAKS